MLWSPKKITGRYRLWRKWENDCQPSGNIQKKSINLQNLFYCDDIPVSDDPIEISGDLMLKR